MHVRSLCWRTDLLFCRFNGEILDRGDYLVIRTPSNPTFYWGNFLFFAAPPAPGDAPRWIERFDQEIGAHLPVRHRTFGWDLPADGAPAPDVKSFQDLGFDHHRQSVLVARRPVVPPHAAEGVTVRLLSGDDDWRAAWENQMTQAPEGGSDRASHAEYLTRRMAAYRRMAEAGLGEWFGAFLGNRLVGDLGLFFDGPVGRFQEVETHPDFRRRGICGTLVAEASRVALETWGLEFLVLVAETGEPAERIYSSLGYEVRERVEALQQAPPKA